jgi:hypothetical protein
MAEVIDSLRCEREENYDARGLRGRRHGRPVRVSQHRRQELQQDQ